MVSKSALFNKSLSVVRVSIHWYAYRRSDSSQRLRLPQL